MHEFIKRRPWWMFFLASKCWVTFAPYVYYPRYIKYPQTCVYAEIIKHEEEHLRQQTAIGRWKWLLRYVISRSFRLEQELEAIRVELAVTPSFYRWGRIRGYASVLSSWVYLWAARSEEEVVEKLRGAL